MKSSLSSPAFPNRAGGEVARGQLLSTYGPIAILCVVLLWAYWPTITDLIREWQENDNYSVGQLVPFAALYLVWQERHRLRECEVKPSWGGIAPLLAAQLAYLGGLVFLYESAQRYALALTIVSVVLIVAGRQLAWRLKWVLAFLFLMVPLPGKIHNLVSGPLQDYATSGAVYFLELFGTSVSREGQVLVLNNEVPVAVAEACSGLRMLTAFVVVACVIAYVIDRPRWQKAVVVVSSVPVAIVCNLIRLVVTAELFVCTRSDIAETFFHDFAGLTMMPLAIAMILGELWLLAQIVETEDEEASAARAPVGSRKAAVR